MPKRKPKPSTVRTVTCGLCRLPLVVKPGANEAKILRKHFKDKHGA